MAAAKRHIVTAALVVVKVPGAKAGETYFRRGRVLPDSVPAKEIKRLTALGLIAEEEVVKSDTSASDVVEIPEGDPVEAWSVPQVDAFAKREEIDLGSAKTKPEKIAAIAAALKEKRGQ